MNRKTRWILHLTLVILYTLGTGYISRGVILNELIDSFQASGNALAHGFQYSVGRVRFKGSSMLTLTTPAALIDADKALVLTDKAHDIRSIEFLGQNIAVKHVHFIQQIGNYHLVLCFLEQEAPYGKPLSLEPPSDPLRNPPQIAQSFIVGFGMNFDQKTQTWDKNIHLKAGTTYYTKYAEGGNPCSFLRAIFDGPISTPQGPCWRTLFESMVGPDDTGALLIDYVKNAYVLIGLALPYVSSPLEENLPTYGCFSVFLDLRPYCKHIEELRQSSLAKEVPQSTTTCFSVQSDVHISQPYEGMVVKSLPHGYKEITYFNTPYGAVTECIYPSGLVYTFYYDGSLKPFWGHKPQYQEFTESPLDYTYPGQQNTYEYMLGFAPHVREILYPLHNKKQSVVRRIYPDGTAALLYHNGKRVYKLPNGWNRILDLTGKDSWSYHHKLVAQGNPENDLCPRRYPTFGDMEDVVYDPFHKRVIQFLNPTQLIIRDCNGEERSASLQETASVYDISSYLSHTTTPQTPNYLSETTYPLSSQSRNSPEETEMEETVKQLPIKRFRVFQHTTYVAMCTSLTNEEKIMHYLATEGSTGSVRPPLWCLCSPHTLYQKGIYCDEISDNFPEAYRGWLKEAQYQTLEDENEYHHLLLSARKYKACQPLYDSNQWREYHLANTLLSGDYSEHLFKQGEMLVALHARMALEKSNSLFDFLIETRKKYSVHTRHYFLGLAHIRVLSLESRKNPENHETELVVRWTVDFLSEEKRESTSYKKHYSVAPIYVLQVPKHDRVISEYIPHAKFLRE